MQQEVIYLREFEILVKFPMSHVTLWRKVRDGSFPQPVYFGVGSRIKAWNC